MDDIAKAKLRNRARILHWVTELILACVLVLTVALAGVWQTYKKAVGDIFMDQELSDASRLVTAEFIRFYFGRGTEMIAYPPPESAAERAVWADKIARDFRQPVAVFVKDRSGLQWLTRPQDFAPGIEHVERFFTAGADSNRHATHHVVGLMDTRQISFESDTLGFKADIVGPLNDSLRWGIVRRYWDTWRAFLISLNDPQTVVRPQHPAHVLQRVVLLPSDLTQRLPKLRASVDGEVIFASPKLDTTRHKYVYQWEQLRQEYYGTSERASQAVLITRPNPWWKFVVPTLLLMLIVHVYWLWIKKLTAPSA